MEATVPNLSDFLPHFHTGKVRETYRITGHPRLLLVVATDRVSTHNIVHKSLIPGKGEVLTALTIFWLTGPLRHLPNHLVASGDCIYEYLPLEVRDAFPDLHHRAIVVRMLGMPLVESIFRSRLTGSLKKAYDAGLDPYGLNLPSGLVEMSQFPQGTVFTPTRKSKNDAPRKWKNTVRQFPGESMLAAEAYAIIRECLARVNITIVDSKFEIGLLNGVPHLADEVGTSDSSRFVEADKIHVGVSPPWMDKQILRDVAEAAWEGGTKYPLNFSQSAVTMTVDTLHGLVKIVTGDSIETWKKSGRFDFDVAV